MIQHTMITQINSPVEQVFTFLTDHCNLSMWQSDLVESEQLTPGPLSVGTTFREVRRQGKRLVEIRSKLTDYQPNKRFSLQTETAPHATIHYSFEEGEDGTLLGYQFTLNTQGLMRLFEPMIASSIKKQSSLDFSQLKRLLENGPNRTTPVTNAHDS